MIMLSCKEASRYLSLAQDRPLTLGELVKLRLHLSMCGTCRNFSHNLKVIRQGARASFKPD